MVGYFEMADTWIQIDEKQRKRSWSIQFKPRPELSPSSWPVLSPFLS